MRDLPEHDAAGGVAGRETARRPIPDDSECGEFTHTEQRNGEHTGVAPQQDIPPKHRSHSSPRAAHRQDHVHSISALSASVAHRLLPATRATAEEQLPRRYRALLGCVFAVSAVFGCVAVGCITAGAPDPTARAAPISGPAALRPEALIEHEWPFTGTGRVDEGGGAGPDPRIESPAAPIVRSEAPSAEVANPAAGSQASTVRVVEEFYRRLAESPSTAPELLEPSLRGHDPGELVRAWSAADEVGHRVRSTTEHRALVRLEADFPGGRRVVLHQQLTIEAGSQPRIRDVTLLSGRYTPSA